MIALAVSLSAGVSAEAQSTTFSAVERRHLANGELVVRRETRRRGNLRLIGGTSWQVVNAAPDRVWRAVLDTRGYRRFIPQVAEARVVRRRTGSQLVYIRHHSGPVDVGYHLSIQYQNAQQMARFRVDRSRPHDIRDGWGFFIVTPYGRNRSLVTFGVLADVGSGVVTGLLRPRVHEWMLRIPEQLKRHVENGGGARSGG